MENLTRLCIPITTPLPSPLAMNHSTMTIPRVLGVSPSPEPPYFSSSSSVSPPSFSSSLNYRYPGDLGELNSLYSIKAMHAQTIKMSRDSNSSASVMDLIDLYLRAADRWSALILLFMGRAQWDSFIDRYEASGGDAVEILQVFSDLFFRGATFRSNVFAFILRICAASPSSWLGLEIHALLIKRGLDMDARLKRSLVSFYGRSWGIDHEVQVFDEMPPRDELTWNTVVGLNFQNGCPEKALRLFREMQFSWVKPDGMVVVKVLQACGKMGHLDKGKQIHGYVLRFALESNIYICNSLITMYSKNNNLELARNLFYSMKCPTVSSWNSIISAYISLGYLNDAKSLLKDMKSSGMSPDIVNWNCLLSGHLLHGTHDELVLILRKMQADGFKPNSTTIITALQSSSSWGFLNFGKEAHGYAIRNEFQNDAYVATSLVDMYVKNNDLIYAQAVFDNMTGRKSFAWNSLMSGYSFAGQFEVAWKLLNRMDEEGVKPDLTTWNGLVSGYSMWGHVKEAVAVIRRMKSVCLVPNVVSWTALISGCSKSRNYWDSFKFFIQMQKEGVEPNMATMSSLLQACAGLSLLQKGKEMHCLSIRKGFDSGIAIATALIDMYSRSGDLKSAREVFWRIEDRTLASWNCMITGFSMYGLADEAISHFDQMGRCNIQPDAITFTALLTGVKNSGLVREGWKIFDSMSTVHNMTPTIEHYSCMVELLGKAGFADEAWNLIETMPVEPDAAVWGALLRTSRLNKNLAAAEMAAKKLFELEPYNSVNYLLMRNLYADCRKWKEVDCLDQFMRESKVKNCNSWSWIEIDHQIHVFSAEGKAHPDEGEIYFELYQLVSEMKKIGYVPGIEKGREGEVLKHGEKLAITYGLMRQRKKGVIRVIKNTRVCLDCHRAARYMTLVKGCEILLKDGSRFHHFRGGKCSCNGCW